MKQREMLSTAPSSAAPTQNKEFHLGLLTVETFVSGRKRKTKPNLTPTVTLPNPRPPLMVRETKTAQLLPFSPHPPAPSRVSLL